MELKVYTFFSALVNSATKSLVKVSVRFGVFRTHSGLLRFGGLRGLGFAVVGFWGFGVLGLWA